MRGANVSRYTISDIVVLTYGIGFTVSVWGRVGLSMTMLPPPRPIHSQGALTDTNDARLRYDACHSCRYIVFQSRIATYLPTFKHTRHGFYQRPDEQSTGRQRFS